MAHLSGFAGSMAWDGGSANTPDWADAVGSVMRWTLHHTQTLHETPVQGAGIRASPGVSLVNGLVRWIARVEFLVPAGMSAGTNMTTGLGVTANLFTETGFGIQGSGVIETYDEDSPLDGPVTAVCTIRGDGVMTELDT